MKKKHTFKTYLLTGILVMAPVVITIYLAIWFLQMMDGWVKYVIPDRYVPYFPYGIPGLGIVLLILFLVLVGMLTTNFMGRWILRMGQGVLAKLPVISGIYATLKKVFETLMGRGGTKAFRQAVLIEYPRRGVWTIAFLTGHVSRKFHRYLPRDMVTVYVPITPNPTSGFMLFVAKKDIKILDMPVDEAFKMVLSMGILDS